MKDIWNEVIQWSQAKPSFVIARVIRTWRSAPRKAGAAMLIDAEMNVVGSVSGGCIEGAVIEEAMRILRSGGKKCLDYGIDDDTAWSVGLACGGEVSVLLEKHWAVSGNPQAKKIWDDLKEAIRQKKSAGFPHSRGRQPVDTHAGL